MKTQAQPRPTSRLPGRRGPSGWLAAVLLVVSSLVVGVTGFHAGSRNAQSGDVARPAPPTSEAFSAASSAPSSTAPSTTTPAHPRVLALVTKNLGTEENPDRVYLAQGQKGIHPVFIVRPGELIQVRIDNRDTVLHTWTFPEERRNLEAYEDPQLQQPLTEISTTKPFLAPTSPGRYRFYCRYRKPGMFGWMVVRGQPVRNG
jgi:hypothetical protein